jgi:hypothetical protein
MFYRQPASRYKCPCINLCVCAGICTFANWQVLVGTVSYLHQQSDEFHILYALYLAYWRRYWLHTRIPWENLMTRTDPRQSTAISSSFLFAVTVTAPKVNHWCVCSYGQQQVTSSAVSLQTLRAMITGLNFCIWKKRTICDFRPNSYGKHVAVHNLSQPDYPHLRPAWLIVREMKKCCIRVNEEKNIMHKMQKKGRLNELVTFVVETVFWITLLKER